MKQFGCTVCQKQQKKKWSNSLCSGDQPQNKPALTGSFRLQQLFISSVHNLFLKKTIRPNFPALLSVLLSCQSHPHEPRGADWPDRHLLHCGPGVNSSSSLPHAAATSFSCVKDEDRLTLQAWSSGEMLQTPHLKAAGTSDQTANITEWWRENLEILSFSIIYILVHNASWFVQNCSTSNCWEKVWICFHTEVKYSWKYSVLQVVDKKKKTLHNNIPILLFDRFMLNKNELKVNDTHVYSFNS